MAKKAVKKEGKLQSTFAPIKNSVPVITDAVNKIWTLVVFFTLVGAAYVIFMCSEAGVPEDLRRYLSGALVVLALMFLWTNLRSSKPVVE
ncbi:hypothetical protein HZA56_14090 [Candidatus Poribacteria bacterium]|nr:hypothetical protein [Candidatus Poribacteria bacterium]